MPHVTRDILHLTHYSYTIFLVGDFILSLLPTTNVEILSLMYVRFFFFYGHADDKSQGQYAFLDKIPIQ